MKRKNIRKLTTVFLALFLVCVCLVTVFAFPVSAASATNKGKDKEKKDRPKYTETLEKNNELLGKVLEELSKEENKILKVAKNSGKDFANTAFSFIEAVSNSSEDKNSAKISVDLTKGILTAVASFWGLGGVTDAVLDGIESLLASGQAPLSEVQVLSDDMNKRFNAIGDQLYDIQEELGALSNQVTSMANDVLSGTQSQINNLEAKQILRSFMSSGEGNFSYLEFSNYLYGNKSPYVNASEAYYTLLQEALVTGAGEEQITYYYDKLFDSVYSNINIYNQYYYGDIAGLDKSMASYYYDYLSYNPNLIDDGKSAEYHALLFALDLYQTYTYAYNTILKDCFT
ncbi:MAG: hypothetical protein E7363_05720 [Clostridiales bacterium]|nr:hypothetical protein [Clostridiales bacterium]